MGAAQQILLGAGGGAAGDPYFSSVVALCHFDGADGSTTFTNVVYPSKGETITAGGSAQVDTAQYQFGGGSLLIGNAASTYAISSSHADYAFGTADFTIEFSLYTSANEPDIVFDMRPASTNGAYAALSTSSGGDLYYYVNSSTRITGTSVLSTVTWNKVAISRVGGTTRMFVNGSQVGSSWTDSTNYLQSRFVLGASSNSLGSDPWTGWIDELRITNGVGRYSSSYTPAGAAFPDA